MVRTKHQQRNKQQRRKCKPVEHTPTMIWASVVYEPDMERMNKAKLLGTITPALYKRSRESKGTFVRNQVV